MYTSEDSWARDYNRTNTRGQSWFVGFLLLLLFILKSILNMLAGEGAAKDVLYRLYLLAAGSLCTPNVLCSCSAGRTVANSAYFTPKHIIYPKSQSGVSAGKHTCAIYFYTEMGRMSFI